MLIHASLDPVFTEVHSSLDESNQEKSQKT